VLLASKFRISSSKAKEVIVLGLMKNGW
jgi:hypothetical protein